ncbi:hypothetical protein [Priestia koreensis]|nr:hypothetical protein [Priestia koreensis]
MFLLNKKTGVQWDVEGELMERLLKDDDYELVKEEKKASKKKVSSSKEGE